MPYALNECPNLALKIFQEKKLKRSMFTNKLHCFPKTVLVMQDDNLQNYIDCIKRTLFHAALVEVRQNNECLHWQLRQTFKILNAALASIHVSLNEFKNELLHLRNELEQSLYIQEWLQQIDTGMIKTHLNITGHGECNIQNGFIKNFYGSHVELHNPIGTAMSVSFGAAIENEVLNKENVYVSNQQNCALSFKPKSYDYPKNFNRDTLEKLPDMRLQTGGNLKAKIVESKTGRVLLEIDESIKLSEILAKFPGRSFIWSACTVIIEQGMELSCNKNFYIRHTSDQKVLKKVRPEALVRKLRLGSQKLTYDQNFSLFANDRRGTLNPEIEQEVKRLKK